MQPVKPYKGRDAAAFGRPRYAEPRPGRRCRRHRAQGRRAHSLLAREPADLRQTHQDGNGGRQPDAVDAVDQRKPLGKVGMLADRDDQSLECGLLTLFEASDILPPELANPNIVATLDPVLEARDILTDLIDHGQLLGEWQ